ncbi:MAG: FecR domain-containing protein [Emcibacter sp.]|nr:FecR domain-containing protein [Emcibacter sp.]
MKIKKLRNEQIVEEACEWAVKLDSACLTEQDKKSLALWLSESPVHVDELLLSAAIITGLGEVDADKNISIEKLLKENAPEVVTLFRAQTKTKPVEQNGTSKEKTARIRRYFSAIAATFVLAIMATFYLFVIAPNGQDHVSFATKTGEQRSLTMTDGSIIHVNTESEIRIRYSKNERHVELLSGEAIFEVAHDTSRPFRVYTGTAMTQAVGTIFNVRHMSGITKVAVIEGTVVVRPEDSRNSHQSTIDVTDVPKKIFLHVGEQASITQDSNIILMATTNIQAISSWRMRKLIFKSDTLADIAIEFNRYNQEQIFVDDQAISGLRFSGVFNADDPHSFIKIFRNVTCDTY